MAKNTMAEVDVVLCTYNGSRFIEEQLKSIDDQEKACLNIIWSDDQSTDGTQEIIRSLNLKNKLTNVGGSARLGVVRNFEQGLYNTSSRYIALADQDDFWHPNKIQLMIARMRIAENVHGANTPLLVFSDIEVVDEQLRTIFLSFYSSTLKSNNAHKGVDFLLSNHIPGCAMLLNKPLLDLVLPFPEGIMHDHWIAFTAAVAGNICFVNEALIKYRQHNGNVVGVTNSQGNVRGVHNVFAKWFRIIYRRPRYWRELGAQLSRIALAADARLCSVLHDGQDKLALEYIANNDVLRLYRLLSNMQLGIRHVDLLCALVFWKFRSLARRK